MSVATARPDSSRNRRSTISGVTSGWAGANELGAPDGLVLDGRFVVLLERHDRTDLDLAISAFATVTMLGAFLATLGQGLLFAAMTAALVQAAAAVIAAFGRVISEVGISMMLGGNAKGFTRTMTTAMALEYDKGEFVLAVALILFLWGSTTAAELRPRVVVTMEEADLRDRIEGASDGMM